ncbi:glycosyltransferase [Halonatronum saccharophilum]|uniref:glycosyltransferase n=1 Tax=Halonatronum saccharophilum TaxID=150060 RepID=UPI0004816FB2|nr:glycosyltransferase [Halonatronum saccharophilum]
MKILHIAEMYFTKASGITSAVPPFIEAQNKVEGVSSKLLLSSGVDIPKGFNYNFEVININDIDNLNYFFNDIYKPDLVIFHGVYFMNYIKIYKILRKLNISYVVKPHCSLTEQAQKKKRVKKYISNLIFFNKFLKNAKAISFLNEGERRTSIRINPNSIIIGNGIDKIKQVDKKSKEELEIIYLGRIDFYHKGLDFLLDAIELIKDKLSNEKIKINIYGKGSETEVKKLNEIILKININNLKFKGPVYDEEKDRVFKKANILILTSRFEGLPMTILEALSYGIPCIVTPGTNVSEEINNNNAGWKTSTNPKEIANTILIAINEYKKSEDKYIKDTATLVEKKYLWNSIADMSINKYRLLLKNSM